MRVLWITNILFPEALCQLTTDGALKSSGGWMLGAANSLLTKDNVSLYVASVSTLVNKLTILKGEKIHYFIIPYGKGNMHINHEYDKYWEIINSQISPDIVHIHGTEFSHGYSYMTTGNVKNVVVSIQGLTSVYSRYYYEGMSLYDVCKNLTIKDIIKGSVIKGKKQFIKRGYFEKEMLKMTKHVIGRTSWDKSHVWAINPMAKYHFCNETLRDEFYSGKRWKYENCKKYRIFLSQAGYPIKGLHQVLKAMQIILQHYPETTIRVAGNDISDKRTLKSYLRLSGYGKYINYLISKYQLKDRIEFTGNLNASEMITEYLNSNVFVCPSSIENSPNSLGEAQILGVPCIASYVGGSMDMMNGNEENLYRFEEIEMLAEKVCRIFSSKENQTDMSIIAQKRHNQEFNSEQLLSIYKSIING